LSFLTDEVSSIRAGVEDVNYNLEQIDSSVRTGFQAVEDLLTNIARRLAEHSLRLAEIGEILRRPYETQARELRDEGHKWLTAGIETIGQDQMDNWADALSLFEAILQNPIGKQDYVVWFHIGYLRWQLLRDTASAEAAFNTARRLSASKRDLYHLKSLRHLAYMHYLQGHFENAYESIAAARSFSRDHETLYDSARYAAKTNRPSEALELLEDCINLEPTTIDLMFSEDDFEHLR
jgi:tetratricopeptide (TPR) repeat protein